VDKPASELTSILMPLGMSNDRAKLRPFGRGVSLVFQKELAKSMLTENEEWVILIA
jgi:hypothetical protein